MKKLISMLATFAMVLSVTTSVIPTAFAEDTANEVTDSEAVELTTYQPDSVMVLSGANASNATEAVYGMTTPTGVKKYTPRTNADTYHAAMVYNGNANKAVIAAAKYVVFETDFAGEDIIEISTNTSSTQAVSQKLQSGWTENRWNTLRIVYEAPTTTYAKGRTAFYLNGEVAKDFTENSRAFIAGDARVSFLFNKGEGTLYVKDYCMYTLDTNPGAGGTAIGAALTNADLDIQGSGLIVAPQNVAVSALDANGAEIRVYSDSTFAAQLEGDATLSAGNVVVLEKDGMLGYYDVVDKAEIVVFDGADAIKWEHPSNNVADNGTVSGYAGKVSADNSTLHYLKNTKTAGSLQVIYPGIHYRYVVTKLNFCITNFSGFSDLQLTTSGNASLVIPSSELRSNEWNNIMLLIDTKETKAKAYLNGKMIQDWTVKDGQFLSDETENKKMFRIRVAGDGKADSYFAIDDFEMYTTTHLPEVEMDKDFKEISGTHTTSENRVFYKADATVDDLLADEKYKADGATSVIYDAATGDAVTEGAMPEEARLAVRTNDSTITTYRLIAADEIHTWINAANARAAVAFADEGVMIAAFYDANGRFLKMATPVAVKDGVVKLGVQCAKGETVKFMLWDSLAGMEPVYPSVRLLIE